MARKYKSPGKALKGFGQTPEQTSTAAKGLSGQPPVALSGSSKSASRRLWLASRLQMLNLTLFTFFAILGYVQYFLHQAPVISSLVPGVGFTAILLLYIYILTLRRKR